MLDSDLEVETSSRAQGGKRPSLAATIARTSVANIAVPVSALLTGPLLARTLGPDGRGALAAILTPLTFVTLLGALGLPEAIVYVVAKRAAPLRRVLRAGLAIGFTTGLVSAAVMYFLAPTLLRNSPQYINLMRWLCALLPLSMAMAAVRSIAQGLGRFDLANTERWLSIFTRLPLLFALAFAGALTVNTAAWATHGTGVLAMMVLWLVLRDFGREEPSAVRLGRTLLSFGTQAWVGTIAVVLVMRLDQALLAPLVGAAQLGYYAVAVSLAEVPSTLLVAVRDVMFATATRRQEPWLIAQASRTLLLAMTGLSVIGVVLAPVMLPLIFGSDFRPAIGMAQILFGAGIFAGPGAVLAVGLMSVGRPRDRSLVQLAGLVVNVAVLLLLVGPLEATGAAWATVAAYAATAILALIQFTRLTPVTTAACLLPRREDVRTLVELPARLLRGGQRV
jgi:O-antigen/teichoic acid export membrane protein